MSTVVDPAGGVLIGSDPVVEGIAYRRADRDELRAEASGALRAGDGEAALVALLADQDDWAPLPPPPVEVRGEVVRGVDRGMTLREAMVGLGFGPVADYFAHRLGDPTYLSGLALLGAHWPGGRPRVVELACGIGHYLRDLAAAGARPVGVDVVFAKLWLARRFLAPTAQLVCADAARGLPVVDGAADLALCHDALYFLPDPAKAVALAELRRAVGPAGTVLVGHAHNALVDNLSAGCPLPPGDWAELLPGALLYDDAELTAAFLGRRRPVPCGPEALSGAAAVALAARGRPPAPPADLGPEAVPAPIGRPRPGTSLRLNPLLQPLDPAADPLVLEPAWPSERYRREYAAASGHLRVGPLPRAVVDAAATGAVGHDPAVDALADRRVLLDLPARW